MSSNYVNEEGAGIARTTIYLPKELLEGAKAHGLNLSDFVRNSLKDFLGMNGDMEKMLRAELSLCDQRHAHLLEVLSEGQKRKEERHEEIKKKIRGVFEYMKENKNRVPLKHLNSIGEFNHRCYETIRDLTPEVAAHQIKDEQRFTCTDEEIRKCLQELQGELESFIPGKKRKR